MFVKKCEKVQIFKKNPNEINKKIQKNLEK